MPVMCILNMQARGSTYEHEDVTISGYNHGSCGLIGQTCAQLLITQANSNVTVS